MLNKFIITFILLLQLLFLTQLPAQQSCSFIFGTPAIPDGDEKTFKKEFQPEGQYNKLGLEVTVEHSWINDLEIIVINPEGKQSIVFSRLGTDDCFGCSGDDLNLTFLDRGAVTYEKLNQTCEDKPAYEGVAQGLESLDSLLNDDQSGMWSIIVKDHWPGEKGKILSLKLHFDFYLPPECADVLYPAVGEGNVPVNSSIIWNEVPGVSGYFINLGSEPGLNDLLYEFDVGMDTFFFPEIYSCGQNYYATITPYNEFGIAQSCQEIMFYTEAVEAYVEGEVSVCLGDSVHLSAYGGTSYLWYPSHDLDDPGSQYPLFNGLNSRLYQIVVSNENNCLDTTWLQVIVDSISIKVDSVNHVRSNSLGFIEISVGESESIYEYFWSGPNLFFSNSEDIYDLEIGCYSLELINTQNYCTLDTVICVDDLTDAGGWMVNDILLYPNPFTDKLMVEVLGPKTYPESFIVIHSILGKTVYRKRVGSVITLEQLSLDHLAPGIYRVQILDIRNSVYLSLPVIKL